MDRERFDGIARGIGRRGVIAGIVGVVIGAAPAAAKKRKDKKVKCGSFCKDQAKGMGPIGYRATIQYCKRVCCRPDRSPSAIRRCMRK